MGILNVTFSNKPFSFPPGWIYDRTGRYTASFLAAGVPPIVGALFMLCIYRVQSGSRDEHAAAADRFADGGRAAAGLEEGEALIDNAVSGLDVSWDAIV